jgi:lysophospholipase L1-like esterase
MKTILCYGDSNTYGIVPGSLNPETQYQERHPREVRWTGHLQTTLGAQYVVIEEGLCARTTNIDYPPNAYPGSRNGKTYLEPCLLSHSPINLTILFLGINDLKFSFNRSPQDIANGLSKLIQIIQSSKCGPDMQSPPKILVVGYPPILEIDPLLKGAAEKSEKLPALYEAVAQQYNCEFLNAAPHTKFSKKDGCHFDSKNHQKFAKLLSKKILSLNL